MQTTSAPSAQETAGVEAQVAPFAVSRAIFQPRSEPAGSIRAAALMYDSRMDSPASSWSPARSASAMAGGPMYASIAASSASLSLAPSGPKNLTPLSEAGLCEAVIATPSAAPPRLAARETAGVGTMPTE